MVSHLLLATDFGKTAELARADAALIARTYAAELDLVHAEHAQPRTEASQKALETHTHALFDAWRRELGALGVRVSSTELMRGSAAESIIDAARRRGADLIVLGVGDRSTPDTDAARTAETLARFAAAPVWVSRPRPRSEISRLLVAFDGSAGSRVALDWAGDFARRLGAELELAQVFEHPSHEPGAALSEELERHARACEARALAALVESSVDPGVVVRHRSWGRAHEVLEGLVLSRSIDLLVLGRTGKAGLRHAYLGSTGERLLRSVACDLLLARPAPAP